MTAESDTHWTLVIFLLLLALIVGAYLGSFTASFNIPSCKIWESKRSYDHILLADTVVCTPANEIDASYYQYDIVKYNGTEYIARSTKTNGENIKNMIVCRDRQV